MSVELMRIDKHNHGFTIWFDKGNRLISFHNWRKIRKQNLKEYGNDPDINNKRQWGTYSNKARKGNPKDSCLDWTLDLGHISINYVNFNFNKKYRN